MYLDQYYMIVLQ